MTRGLKKDIRQTGFIIIFLSFSLFFLYDFGAVSPAINAFPWLAAACCLFHRKIERPGAVKCLVFMFIFLVVINIRGWEGIQRNLYYYTSLIFVSFFLIFIKSADIDLKTYRFVLIPCICYIVVRGVYICSPSLFSVYLNTISSDLRIFVERMIFEGYGLPITLNISLTEYYLFFGINYLIITVCANKQKHKLGTFFKILILLVLIYGLFALKRRTALVAFAIMFWLFLFKSLSRKRKGVLLIISFVSLVVGLAAIGWILLNHIESNNRIIASIINLSQGKDISTGRFDLYEMAFLVFSQHIFTGIGWNNFFRYSTLVDPNVSNAHNIVFQMLSETGIIFTSILLIILILMLFTVYKYIQYPECKYDALFSFNCLIFFAAASIFDNVIYTPNGWLIFLLSILPVLKAEHQYSLHIDLR